MDHIYTTCTYYTCIGVCARARPLLELASDIHQGPSRTPGRPPEPQPAPGRCVTPSPAAAWSGRSWRACGPPAASPPGCPPRGGWPPTSWGQARAAWPAGKRKGRGGGGEANESSIPASAAWPAAACGIHNEMKLAVITRHIAAQRSPQGSPGPGPGHPLGLTSGSAMVSTNKFLRLPRAMRMSSSR